MGELLGDGVLAVDGEHFLTNFCGVDGWMGWGQGVQSDELDGLCLY